MGAMGKSFWGEACEGGACEDEACEVRLLLFPDTRRESLAKVKQKSETKPNAARHVFLHSDHWV